MQDERLRRRVPRDAGEDEQEEYLAVAVAALSAWFADPTLHITGYARLDWVKVNAINPDGQYVHPITNAEYDLDVRGGAGSNTTPIHPLQVSLVVTWGTDVSRGRASKGRIFLPAPFAYMDEAALFTDTVAQDVADASASLIESLTGSVLTSLRFTPAVVSPLGGTSGTIRDIETVTVDTRPDTQRRRANRLNGVKYTTPVS